MKPGNGNYLGQSFDGVQPCPRCGGKGFLNPDGSRVNAFDGSDSDPVIGCPDCQPYQVQPVRLSKWDRHAAHICRVLGVDSETARLSGLATYLEVYVAGELRAQISQALKILGESPDASGIMAAVLVLNREGHPIQCQIHHGGPCDC